MEQECFELGAPRLCSLMIRLLHFHTFIVRILGNATISDITFENIHLISGISVGVAMEMDYETPGSTLNNSGCTANSVAWRNVYGNAGDDNCPVNKQTSHRLFITARVHTCV